MKGFFKSFLGDEPASPNHDKQDWERREKKQSSVDFFHLKILRLFSESFSSEP